MNVRLSAARAFLVCTLRRPPVWRFIGLWSLLLLLAWGCARSTPLSFYLLEPTLAHAPAAGSPERVAQLLIGVGPVQLPDYLTQPEMVTRTGPLQLRLSEFHHWAEPLDRRIATVLAANLESLLPAYRIVGFPHQADSPPDLLLGLQVERFDADTHGGVVLAARVTLRRSSEATPSLSGRRLRVEHPITAPGYHGIAQAHSAALAEFSTLLAQILREAVSQPLP